ncbi:hypothetical protein EOPP23_09265 [Endozoicomonas sp. OPT23]|uniref:hypothetical protein n=1 Tax=Endozoicomonas sp. OPT23 TaxID=2072845 RepID=UPI00129BA7B1|nr:hypothetical protein [Endozoicomonas sp. OPT23]MRI33171.1 hypothetical protein [Endozoicomonas sp. OPT23]
MSWPPVRGSVGTPPTSTQSHTSPPVPHGKTSNLRSISISPHIVSLYSNDLDTLIGQVAKRFNQRTANTLQTLGLYKERKAQPLSLEQKAAVISLAEYIYTGPEGGRTKRDLKSYIVREALNQTIEDDSGYSSSDSTDSINSVAPPLSPDQEREFYEVCWDQGEELAQRRLRFLKNDPLIIRMNELVKNQEAMVRLMNSKQAAPLIDKLLQRQKLTDTEAAALLSQVSHLDAILQKERGKSYQSAEAAMPYSSSVDITQPETTCDILELLGGATESNSLKREIQLSELGQLGLKSLAHVDATEKKHESGRSYPHLRKSAAEKGMRLEGEAADLEKFRAKMLSDYAYQSRATVNDFSSASKLKVLVESVQQDAVKTAEHNARMSEVLFLMKERAETWKRTSSMVALSQLCSSLRDLAELNDDPHLSETLELLADHLSDQVLSHTRAEFEAELRRQLRDLEKGGAARSIMVSVNLGASLAAYGIKGVSLDLGMDFTFKVTGNDDTRVREFKVINSTCKVTGGDEKIITGSAELGIKVSKGKVFRNLDDFVSFHANDIAPLLLTRVEKLAGNAKGVVQVRRQQALKQKVVADADLLTKRLQENGILLTSQRVKVEAEKKPNYAEFRRAEGSLKGEVTALEGMLDASLKATNTVTKFTTRTDLLDALKNNPDKFYTSKRSRISLWVPASKEECEWAIRKKWCEKNGMEGFESKVMLSNLTQQEKEDLLAEASDGAQHKQDSAGRFQKRVSGDEGIGWIKAQQRQLHEKNVSKSARLEIREKCKQAILDQYAERDLYYHTLNAMDGHIGVEHHRKARLATVEKSFREVVNAKSRGEFIEIHTFTYFRLWMTYMMTFTKDENPAVDDALFFQPLEQFIEPTLTNPQVHLSDENDVRKHLRLPAEATSSAKSIDGEIAIKVPHTSIKGAANFTYIRTEKNTNPDNDGEYMNLSFTVGAGGHLGKAIHLVGEALKQKNLDGSQTPNPRLELFLSGLETGDFDMTAEADVKLELNFIHRDRKLYRAEDQEKDWHLQYVRVSGSNSLGVKTPNIGIPTGPVGQLNLGFGAKVSGVNNWYERAGNNTLTYVYTKYNGWKSGRKVGGDSCYWKAWAEQNRKYFHEMLVYMGRSHKNAYEEMNETFKSIEANFPSFSGTMSYQQLMDFKKKFIQKLSLFSVCDRLDRLIKKKTVSEGDMRKAYLKIIRDWPAARKKLSVDQFVALRSRVKSGDSPALYAALGIDKKKDQLDYDRDMMPMFQQFLDLEHQAYLQEARRRYTPSFKHLRIV